MGMWRWGQAGFLTLADYKRVSVCLEAPGEAAVTQGWKEARGGGGGGGSQHWNPDDTPGCTRAFQRPCRVPPQQDLPAPTSIPGLRVSSVSPARSGSGGHGRISVRDKLPGNRGGARERHRGE